MRAGAAIADQLPAVRSTREVAAVFGVSHQKIREIECLALAKLALALGMKLETWRNDDEAERQESNRFATKTPIRGGRY